MTSYIVWVGGVADQYTTLGRATRAKSGWEAKGYDDVQIETIPNPDAATLAVDGYDFPWDFRLTTNGTVVELTYEGESVFELRSKSMPDTESAAIVCNALNRDSIEQVRLAESI